MRPFHTVFDNQRGYFDHTDADLIAEHLLPGDGLMVLALMTNPGWVDPEGLERFGWAWGTTTLTLMQTDGWTSYSMPILRCALGLSVMSHGASRDGSSQSSGAGV